MYQGKVCLLATLLSVPLIAVSPADISADIRRGQLLQSHGQFNDAENLFRFAARQAETVSIDLELSALSNLASVEIDLAKPDEAAKAYEYGLRLITRNGGDGDPRAQRQRILLAELYLDAGQTAEAEKLVRAAL